MRRGHLPDRRLQRIEGPLGDEAGNVRGHAAARMGLIDHDEAADNLAKKGITCTVVDPRTTSPLDRETILETVEETGRLVVVDEAHPRCSMASDIAGLVAEEAFGALKAPIKLVTAPHVPVPFSPALEDIYIPSVAKIEAAVRAVMEYDRKAAAE